MGKQAARSQTKENNKPTTACCNSCWFISGTSTTTMQKPQKLLSLRIDLERNRTLELSGTLTHNQRLWPPETRRRRCTSSERHGRAWERRWNLDDEAGRRARRRKDRQTLTVCGGNGALIDATAGVEFSFSPGDVHGRDTKELARWSDEHSLVSDGESYDGEKLCSSTVVTTTSCRERASERTRSPIHARRHEWCSGRKAPRAAVESTPVRRCQYLLFRMPVWKAGVSSPGYPRVRARVGGVGGRTLMSFWFFGRGWFFNGLCPTGRDLAMVRNFQCPMEWGMC